MREHFSKVDTGMKNLTVHSASPTLNLYVEEGDTVRGSLFIPLCVPLLFLLILARSSLSTHHQQQTE